VTGTVINAKVFSRKGVDKDERAKDIENRKRPSSSRTRTTRSRSSKTRPTSGSSGCCTARRPPRSWSTTRPRPAQQGPGGDRHAADEIPEKYWPEIAVGGAEEKVAKILENFNEQRSW